jgi:hypothetical protein
MPWSGCAANSEFIELMNFGPGPMNVGCYIVTNGQYSVTIPANTVLQPGEYYVIAGQNTLAAGCGNADSAVSVDLNWNTCNCTNTAVPTSGDGFFQNGGSANEKAVLLSPTLAIVDAVTRSLPVTSSASITTSTNAGSCTARTFDLDLMGISYEAFNTATGIDNSYSRRVDGDCGWVKTTGISAGAPNKTGSSSSATYSFSTLSASQCNGTTGSISISVSASNVSSLFPMTYTLAYDRDSTGTFSGSDTYSFGTDSSSPSIDINNLAYGRYRITVGSSSGCNLQSYDFFIFNCYGVVLPYRSLSFNYDDTRNGRRWFNLSVESMKNLASASLEAKQGNQFVTVQHLNVHELQQEETLRFFVPMESRNTYRIRLVAQTGEVFYSKEVITPAGSQSSFIVWPNPAYSELHVQVPGSSKDVRYKIVSSMGSVASAGLVSRHASGEIKVSVASLPNGIYKLLIVDTAGQTLTTTFVKN